MGRVYNQKVWATMHRIETDLGYVFLRKDTEVCFGDDDDRVIGAVCMTNPGSYAPRTCVDGNWDAFCKGEEKDQIRGWGYPDLTMQNVIQALLDAAKEARKPLAGKLKVYNLSAVVQPKGEDAETYHNSAESVLDKDGRKDLLFEPWLRDRESFINYFSANRYPLVVLGFVDQLFLGRKEQVQNWAKELPHVYFALDNSQRWAHPRRWRMDPELGGQIREKLTRHFKA